MSPERTARISLIRGRIVGGAIALFVTVWGVIGIQLASGHDPALGSSDATSSSNSSSATTSGESDDQLTTSDDSSSDVSPVTTQQS
jgi:hypothetical protein